MSGAASHYNLAIIITEQRRGHAIRALQQDVTKGIQKIDAYSDGTARAATATDKWRERAGKLGNKIKNVMVPAILLASTAAIAFARDGVQQFATFDQKMHETFTLMPDTSDAFREGMMSDLRSVGEEMGMLSDETLPGLYQALSAGIPEGNAVEAVALASKAAVAGASDLESTMRLGAAVVNAYGGEIYDLNQTYDIMFQLIDKGVPRMSDWTASMQNVTSIASESRVPFEDVAAALAIMTQQGDSAAESTELLGFLLMQLSISGTGAAKAFAEASGMSFRKWVEEGGGLVDALVLMESHAISTGQELGDLIGGDSKFFRDQQAARASLELTGVHLQDLVDMRKNFNEEAIKGLNDEAFAEASDNAQFKLDQMAASWETVKIEIGKAIWEQDLFLGKSGEQMAEYAMNFARFISKSWADFDASTVQKPLETMDQLIAKNEELMDVRIKMFATGVYTDWQDAWKSNIMRIGEVSSSYDEFYQTLRKIDALKGKPAYIPTFEPGMGKWDKIEIINSDIKGMQQHTFELYNNIKAEEMRASTAATAAFHESIVNKERQTAGHRYRLTQESANALLLDFTDLQEQAARAQTDTTNTFLDMSLMYGQLSYDVRDFKENPIWKPIEVTPIDSMVLDSFEKQKDNYIALYDAEQRLQENGGDWREFIVNNEGQIAAEMEKITQDLTDVEKDAMWEIVRTAEEGGAEWLDAWGALQTDLTEVQRAETIKRLADLTDANGEMGKSWDGNKDDALDAAEDIIDALERIQEEHDQLVLATARSKFIERFGEESKEMQLAYLALQVEMGKIPEDAAKGMAAEIEYGENVKRVSDIMLDGYLEDGILTAQEIENIGRVGDITKGQIDNLTDQGVQAFLDKALSESGGFPYVGKTIKTKVEDPTRLAMKQMQEMVREGPYEPEFKIDKKAFDTTYGEMTRLISNALGPHKVQFYGVYNGYRPPGEGGGGNEDDTSPPNASGIRGGIVPSGYPNDSYLVRMSTGEGYNVYRRGEQTPQNNGGGGGDTYNTTINNHTRAAANVAASQMEALTRKRINGFMGE